MVVGSDQVQEARSVVTLSDRVERGFSSIWRGEAKPCHRLTTCRFIRDLATRPVALVQVTSGLTCVLLTDRQSAVRNPGPAPGVVREGTGVVLFGGGGLGETRKGFVILGRQQHKSYYNL